MKNRVVYGIVVILTLVIGIMFYQMKDLNKLVETDQVNRQFNSENNFDLENKPFITLKLM